MTTAAPQPLRTERTLLRKVGDYTLLTARQGAASAVSGDYIYIFGGGGGGGFVADIERFDPRTGKSECVSDRVLPRHYHCAVEYEGRIYLFGGQGVGLATQPYEARIEMYDVATNTVAIAGRMPEPRTNLGAAKLGTKVYLIGGRQAKDEQRIHVGRVDVYDLKTGIWSRAAEMAVAREAPAATVTGFIIVPAGYRGRMRLADVEMFVPAENVWKTLPSLGRRISAHSLAFLDRYLFLFGDYDDLGTVTAYDLKTRATINVVTGFTGLRHSTAAVHRGVIYVIGGNTDLPNSESDRIQAFALASATAPAPVARPVK
ncbi:MAG: kelch repeat-containing protein [Opitutaceae bacterium]|nr:kelch repeat-containing protein [Opitutaceae bacterium]